MNKQEIICLFQQAFQDGDTYVIVQRGSYIQIGLCSSDGKETVNITASVCQAFGLPHHGCCAVGDEAQIRVLLPTVQKAAPKAKKQAQVENLPDFDSMSGEDKIAWIVAPPDDIAANKAHWA